MVREAFVIFLIYTAGKFLNQLQLTSAELVFQQIISKIRISYNLKSKYLAISLTMNRFAIILHGKGIEILNRRSKINIYVIAAYKELRTA